MEEKSIQKKKKLDEETCEFQVVHNGLLNKIRSYKKQLSKNNIGFLDFDQYGYLTFLCTDQPEHKVMEYLLNFFNTKEQKILTLF